MTSELTCCLFNFAVCPAAPTCGATFIPFIRSRSFDIVPTTPPRLLRSLYMGFPVPALEDFRCQWSHRTTPLCRSFGPLFFPQDVVEAKDEGHNPFVDLLFLFTFFFCDLSFLTSFCWVFILVKNSGTVGSARFQLLTFVLYFFFLSFFSPLLPAFFRFSSRTPLTSPS